MSAWLPVSQFSMYICILSLAMPGMFPTLREESGVLFLPSRSIDSKASNQSKYFSTMPTRLFHQAEPAQPVPTMEEAQRKKDAARGGDVLFR